MFCNFCGKKISPEKRVCPFCSQPQEPRKGGSGFWDIFTPQSVPAEVEKPTVQQSTEQKPAAAPKPASQSPRESRRKKKRGTILWVVRLAVLVLLLIVMILESVAFSGLQRQKKELGELERKLDRHIAMYDSANKNNAEASTDASEKDRNPSEPKETKETKETQAEKVPADTETTEPEEQMDGESTESTPVEGSEKPHIQKAEGQDAEYKIAYEGVRAVWSYREVDKWIEIKESDQRFQISNEQGFSSLRIIANDKNLWTGYRCTIIGADGTERISDEVLRIIEEPKTQDTQPTGEG